MNSKNFSNNRDTGPLLGQRHLQALLLFSSIVVNYIGRYNISFTVVAIAEESRGDPLNLRYKWDEIDKSFVLSSFFWGYCLTQIPGSYLCRRIGIKLTMFIATFGSSAFGILPPFFGGNFKVFCIVRAIQGIFQGCLIPAIHGHLAAWCPKNEHNRLGAFVGSGVDCGIILALYVSGMLKVSYLRWQFASYFSAVIGLIWCFLWFLFGANTPNESKLISAAELNYIESSKAGVPKTSMDVNKTTKTKIPIPWKGIFTSGPFLALLVARMGEAWGMTTLIAQMPSYLSNFLGLDMKNNAIFSALPYLVMLCMSYVFLISSDLLIGYQVMTLGTLRKTFNSIAFFLPAIILICLGFVEKDQKTLAISLLTLSLSLNAGHIIGSGLNTLDLSPNHAGILRRYVNTYCSTIPIITPIVVGIIVKDETDRTQWQVVFSITSVIFTLCNLFYIMYGSAELQPWDAQDYMTKIEVPSVNVISKEKKEIDKKKEEKKKIQDSNQKKVKVNQKHQTNFLLWRLI